MDYQRLDDGYEAKLRDERRRARDAGREYAEMLDLEIWLDPGAPLPHVLADSYNAFVLFHLHPIPVRDTATVAGADARDVPEPAGLIQFTGVHSVLFGGPNDEALDGHPLHGHGLRRYAIHEVHKLPMDHRRRTDQLCPPSTPTRLARHPATLRDHIS